jgi:hypothetical protein
MGLKKKTGALGKEMPGDCVEPLTGIWKKLPLLNEFFREGAYEDGAKRARPTLLLFIEDGMWKARLLDRDNDEAAWLSANTLIELLERFEGGLGMEGLEWRKAPPARGQKK